MNNSIAYKLAEENLALGWATELIKEVLVTHQENSSYIDTFAWIRYRQGLYGEAEELIRKALQFSKKDSAAVLFHAGDILRANGKTDEAKYYWLKALELDKKFQEQVTVRLRNENTSD